MPALEELVNDNYGYGPVGQTGQPGALTGARLSSSTLLTQSFFWMFAGLLLTAFVAFLVEHNLGLAQSVYSLWIVFVFAEMGLAIGIQAGIRRLNASTALALFFVYAALNGLTFGVIVLAYSASAGGAATVVEAFLSAAAMFGGAALFGLVTRRNLANMFGIFAMATWGLLVAILLNLLFNNSMLDLLISVAGVVIYAVLTASTTQKITRGDFAYITGSVEKAAVWGALLLYLEFVGIFLFMLRLFGGGRR
jgi:FtsH-binding integral membrane protein